MTAQPNQPEDTELRVQLETILAYNVTPNADSYQPVRDMILDWHEAEATRRSKLEYERGYEDGRKASV